MAAGAIREQATEGAISERIGARETIFQRIGE